MKQLNPDGSISIPSNFPRTRRGPDSRGIRICFAELGRSCSLQMGYLIFTDGSAYAYSAPSNSDTEALCDQFRRGFVFNFFTRRSRFGFVRGFTPPADYETIYTFPPYEGVTPDACPLSFINFNDMVWDPPALDPGVPPRTITCTALNNTITWFCDGRPSAGGVTDFPNGSVGGGFNYTGPGGVCNLHFDIDQGPSVAESFILDFTQDGVDIQPTMPNPPTTGDYAFTVSAGISSVIRFDCFFQGVTGQGPTNCHWIFTPAF